MGRKPAPSPSQAQPGFSKLFLRASPQLKKDSCGNSKQTLVQEHINIHARNYQLCPASTRAMPGFQPLLLKSLKPISSPKQYNYGNIQTIL